MEHIIQQFHTRLSAVNFSFKRYLFDRINWDNRLIAIVGARGVGKTTFLLQHIKEYHTKKDLTESVFVSMDNLYFGKHTLYEFADEFVKYGGKYLYLDEVHKYPNWSIEIKNIYDTYADLFIVITGSSALNIHKGKGDLSRRIVVYKMQGLSFREFIELQYGICIKSYTLEQIMKDASGISQQINQQIKPLKWFKEYLKTGYYPYFMEGGDHYYERLTQSVNEIIETDLLAIEPIDYSTVYNMKKLLAVIAELVPFKPNISKLSIQLGINRDTLLRYLFWLQNADLLFLLTSDTSGIAKMNKPEKVYLNNTNLIAALGGDSINVGTVRETFVLNQLAESHRVSYSKTADFLIDNGVTLEVGGKNKKQKQITGIKNAFIVKDNIEFAYNNVIPVWMFGFLY